jgi:hypothetical protein
VFLSSTLDFHIRLYKPYTVGKLVKKAFDQCNNKCRVPFEKKIVFDIFSLLYLKNRSRHMRPSTLLSKHLTDAANIQESNSVDCFNLCATIWMVRIFEGTPVLFRVLS